VIAAPADAERAQLCAFRVGDEEYVVDIMRVEEIIPVPAITPVRRGAAGVEGVINLRGKIIPVVDLRRQLLGAVPAPGPRERLVLCKVGRHRVALRVDALTAILKAPLEAFSPAPLAGGGSPQVLGVCSLGKRLLLMLDVLALLTPPAGAGRG
jgi:purine-binding chemotaxis protein CheW